MAEYILRPGKYRIALALVSGAAFGAILDDFQYLYGVRDVLVWVHLRDYGLSKGFRFFVLAFIVWLICLARWQGRFGRSFINGIYGSGRTLSSLGRG